MTTEKSPTIDESIPELEDIKQDVDAGKTPKVSVRELLRWFGAHRRGSIVVERIKSELSAAGLRTDPHFTTVWIDAPVAIVKDEGPTKADGGQSATPVEGTTSDDRDDLSETTYLVRMLEAANREVVSVNPQDPIERAITLMLAHDFSQLAVMTGPRDLKGAISWQSIGSRLSQRTELKEVKDAMDPASEVRDDLSLFEATRMIVQRDYVFVRSTSDNRITGIVTATDLSEQFQSLSEPFLLLGRIESQIRRILQKSFDIDTLREACDDNDPDRKAKLATPTQLTFGEYQRIFEKPENWEKLGFVACRTTFCKELDAVREARNEIMHFRPGVGEDDNWEQLRRFTRLLDKLEKLAS